MYMQSNIVFMVNIVSEDMQQSRSRPYQYSYNSWKKWCKRNNVELVLLTERIYDKTIMNPNWHKLFIFDLLKNSDIDYDQILIVDSDTIVHPNCPNFFEMTDDKFVVVNNDGCYDWVSRSVETYSKFLFNDHKLSTWDYFNSGFMIVNKTHKKIFSKVLEFYFTNKDKIINIQKTFGVGTDQPVLNFFTDMQDVDMKRFPYEFNMQDMARKEILDEELTFTKIGWVYHFNAIPDNHDASKTLYWMKKTYEHLYKEELK